LTIQSRPIWLALALMGAEALVLVLMGAEAVVLEPRQAQKAAV